MKQSQLTTKNTVILISEREKKTIIELINLIKDAFEDIDETCKWRVEEQQLVQEASHLGCVLVPAQCLLLPRVRRVGASLILTTCHICALKKEGI